MKTGFISDIHLGAGRDLGVGEYGEGSRFADQCAVLDRAATLFVAEGCDVVCCLGDVFHTPQPKPWEILAFQKFAERLTFSGRKLIVLVGNHDTKSALLPTALHVVEREASFTHLAERPRLIHARPHRYGVRDEAVYACLPWTPLSALIAKEGRDANTRERAIDLLVGNIAALRKECADKHPNATPILLGHWHITGNHMPGGLPTDNLTEPVIPWFDIDAQGWALAAFGHLHRATLIAEGQAETRILSAGSVAVTNLGEISERHGVWIYDHDADELRFRAVEDRPFVDYEADAEAWPDGEGVVLHDFQADAKDAVVRVRYRTNGLRVDEAKVRDALERLGAHKVFIKEIDKPTTSRARAQNVADNITPADALELWLDANNTAADRNDPERFVAALRDKHLDYVERIGK